MLNLKGKDLGRYHLVEPLGEGGMAMVYKAYDAALDRNVAIKVIRTEMGSDPSFLQRFQREAKALAKLDHPYILKVLDYGEQDGVPYLVMPFVGGGTLKARMGQPIAPAETARILAPVARALAYAHQQGIIHRDVKPANILITPTGEPILSDFGIAKLLQQEGANQLTATGVGMGTPDYMAPEQWLGTTDARTDVYALGVILFQMITGRLPYTADTPAAVLLKHMQDPLPRPGDFVPGLPDSVERVIFKALAKEPNERFQSMDAFAGALEGLASSAAKSPALTLPAVPHAAPPGGQPIAPPVSPAPPVARPAQPGAYSAAARPAPAQPPASGAPGSTQPPAPSRRNHWLAVGGGLLALLAAGCVISIALFVLLRGSRGDAQPTKEWIAMEPPPKALTGAAGAPPAATMEAAAAPLDDTPVGEAAFAEPTAAAQATEPAADSTATRRPPFTEIEGLPEDVPILMENNGDLIKQESEGATMYMYTTWLAKSEVAAFFKTELEELGWEPDSTITMESQDALMFAYTKDSRMLMVNVSASDGQTMVVVQIIDEAQ